MLCLLAEMYILVIVEHRIGCTHYRAGACH